MKTSNGSDEPLEGLIAELGGGMLNSQSQKAIINFACIAEDEKEERKVLRSAEEGKSDERNGDDKKWREAGRTEDGAGGQIEFASYDDKVLELDWFSPYACENAASTPDKDTGGSKGGSSGGWGFFSWFFFLVLMLLMAFILFTAWVNYTRNGARGWDLLPFSDTLRDLPYILGDWSRKIASTLGGGGTRGGYSAV